MKHVNGTKRSVAALVAVMSFLMLAGAGCLGTKTTVDMENEEAIGEQNAMMKDKNATMMEKEASSSMMDESTSSMMKEEPTTTKRTNSEATTTVMIKSKGSYEDYAASKLALAKDEKVVLFFKASWCPTCKAVDADITSHLTALPAGVHILKVDYDSSTALKKQYGVTTQHTFIQVDASGKPLNKWSGSLTLASLLGNVK